MGAGSRADPPPRMQKRWQGYQEKEDRRKARLFFPHHCAVGRQRWLENYADISGEFSRLHQWVLITTALHCLQSAMHFTQAA